MTIFERHTLTNNILDLWAEHKSISEICKMVERSEHIIRRILAENGIFSSSFRKREPAHNRKKLPVDTIVSEYIDGSSVLFLSKKYQVSRNVISQRLLENGVQLRTGSEANLIRMGKLSKEERKQLTQKANIACTGKPKGEHDLEEIMRSRYARQTHIGFGEDITYHRLVHLGYSVERQFPIQRYSVDLFVNGTVVVEISCGGISRVFSEHNRTKVKRILKCGLSVVYVSFTSRQIFTHNFENVIPLIEHICRDHDSICPKDWMIVCTSDGSAAGRFQRNHPTEVPPPIHHFCRLERLNFSL
jgi:very-short-patch-repair endonuclease